MDVEKNTDDVSTVLPKRKYQKHSTESKISVRHYLNTKLKGQFNMGGVYYPIYVQVIYQSKTYYAKSFINFKSTEEDFESFKRAFKHDFDSEIDFYKENFKQNGSVPQQVSKLKLPVSKSEMMYTFVCSCLYKEIKEVFSEIRIGLNNKFDNDDNLIEKTSKLEELGSIERIIDWKKDPEDLIEGLANIYNNNLRFQKLKYDFVRKPGYFELLFNLSEVKRNWESVGGWQAGFTQSWTRRQYKGTDLEELCEDYINNINNLLLKHFSD